MNFLILSDSHRNRINVAIAASRAGVGIGAIDAILFLGDGISDLGYENSYSGVPVFKVIGNCDFFTSVSHPDVEDELFLRFEEYNIMMTHGDKYFVKSTLEGAMERAAKADCDILLFGHTHAPLEKYLAEGEKVGATVLKKPLYVFNPGSINEGSFGRLSLSERGVLFSHGSLKKT